MDLDTLRFGRFEKLGTAVADWAKVVSHLETLGEDARDGPKGRPKRPIGRGVNATVTREFITEAAGEFADAHAEASSIHNILKDTHDELVGYRNQLNQAISDGLRTNLAVMDTGSGSFTVTMNIHPDRAAAGTSVPEHSQQDVDHLRDEVQRILKAATESDNPADRALRVLLDQTAYGFSDASHRDRDSAAAPMEEAKRPANLLKSKGDSMPPEESDELNRLGTSPSRPDR
ncbi:hypothetical protein ACWER6_33860 [Streptomyces sp. NPDC004009]